MRPRLARAGLILALSLVLASPALRSAQERVLGSAWTDTAKHVWTLWIGRTMLREEGRLWGHTDLVNHPVGMDLYIIEPLGALFAALVPVDSIVLVANLLALLNLLLLGLCSAFLGDRVAGGVLPGLVSALLALGCSATAFAFHLGVGELQHLFLLPLVLGLLVRLWQERRWRDAVLLGLCIGGAVGSGLYLGLMAAVAALVGGLVALVLGPGRLHLLGGLGLAALLSLLTAAPFLHGLRQNWPGHADKGEGGLIQFVATPLDKPWYRVDLGGAIWPMEVPPEVPAPAYYGGQYLGPVLLGLALVGLWRRPREGALLGAVALTAFVFALGTQPIWFGQTLSSWPDDAALPYAWLKYGLNAVAAAPHYPRRLVTLSAMALAAMGGLAFAGVARPRLALLGPALALLAWADASLRLPGAWPWPTSPVPPTEQLSALHQQDGGAVLDLSYSLVRDVDLRNRTAWFQVGHGLPTQAVAISQLDEAFSQGAARALGLDLVRDLREVRDGGALEGDYRLDIALLQEDGYSWLLLYGSSRPMHEGENLINPGQWGPPRQEHDALSAVLGPPALVEDAAAIWRLPEVQASEEELAAARKVRDQRAREVGKRVFVYD